MLTDLLPPSVEPISRDEAKLFLRVDHDDENDLIDMLIQSARERLEAYLNVAIISRPMRYEAQGGEIKIPRWPVVSIDQVTVNSQAVTAYQADL
ncbi:MAG: head-tail connector protein, partial [Pseudomonadota bacterium]